jgi:hypothetical protein
VTQLFPPTIDEEITEIEREIKLRRRVYPRLVADKRTTQQVADRRIEILESVAQRLRALSGRAA